jgi:hypothetical protein
MGTQEGKAVPSEVKICTESGDEPRIDAVIAPNGPEKAIAGQLLARPPTRPRRPVLKTLPDVRREMARVYREMRRGRLETQDATRMTYVLTQIAKIIQTAELEARIEAVERALGSRRP